VRPDAHLGHTGWDDDAALTAGEGLLVHVGVEQQPGEGAVWIRLDDRAVGREHVPAVGVILPAGVRMLHRHVKGPGAALS